MLAFAFLCAGTLLYKLLMKYKTTVTPNMISIFGVTIVLYFIKILSGFRNKLLFNIILEFNNANLLMNLCVHNKKRCAKMLGYVNFCIFIYKYLLQDIFYH